MTEAMRVCVFGGTGFIGRRLVAALLEAGHWVRVAARRASDPSDPAGRSTGRLDSVHADILEHDTVRAAVANTDMVINLVGALSLPDEQAYFDLHERGARHVAESAQTSGRTRLLHFSALGVAPDAPSAADRSKAAGEAAVRRAFPQASLLRPSLVFGEHDHFVSRLDRVSRASPFIPLVGAATRVQPVHVDDLVEGVLRLVHDPHSDGQLIQAVGPRVYTMRRLVQAFLQARQRRRLIVAVPRRAAGLVGGVAECLPRPPVNRDFFALMQTDKIAVPGYPTLRELGLTPRVFESWLGGESPRPAATR